MDFLFQISSLESVWNFFFAENRGDHLKDFFIANQRATKCMGFRSHCETRSVYYNFNEACLVKNIYESVYAHVYKRKRTDIVSSLQINFLLL